MTKCDMCFQDKSPLAPVVPKSEVMVCKACAYKITQVIGFLEYHKYVIQRAFDAKTSLEATKSEFSGDK